MYLLGDLFTRKILWYITINTEVFMDIIFRGTDKILTNTSIEVSVWLRMCTSQLISARARAHPAIILHSGTTNLSQLWLVSFILTNMNYLDAKSRSYISHDWANYTYSGLKLRMPILWCIRRIQTALATMLRIDTKGHHLLAKVSYNELKTCHFILCMYNGSAIAPWQNCAVRRQGRGRGANPVTVGAGGLILAD